MKIRTDFVTNSSSSSFIACGVYSEELAEFITQLLGGKQCAYDRHQVGVLEVEDNIVRVTTTLDFGRFHIFNYYDDVDPRSDKQIAEDNRRANTPENIYSAFYPFLPTMTAEEKMRLQELLVEANRQAHTAAEVYLDQTDGFEPMDFYPEDFGVYRGSAGRSYTNAWMAKYGDLVTENPLIYFPDSAFVFTGFGWGDAGRSDRMAQEVMRRGGVFRGNVSGKTHYLVVDPAYAGEGKIQAVRRLREKGVYIDVILKSDLARILKEKRTEEQEAAIRDQVLARRHREEAARKEKKREERARQHRLLWEKQRAEREARMQERAAARERWRQEQEAEARLQQEREAKQDEEIVAALQQMKEHCISTGTKFDSVQEMLDAIPEKTFGPAALRRCIRNKYGLDPETYLTANQMLVSDTDRWLAQIEETLDQLAQRYAAAQKKAKSFREVVAEHPDVNVKFLEQKAMLCTGKTPRELLVERGIIYTDSELQAMDIDSVTAQPRDPAEIPPNIQRRMDTLFAKLNEAYPDRVILRLNADHKQWAKTAAELSRALGYDGTREFLIAYGYRYRVTENKGGRPKTNPMEVIEELQRRYPNGADVTTVDALKAANPDLAPRFQSLQNKAHEYFGMTFVKYLRSIGLMK